MSRMSSNIIYIKSNIVSNIRVYVVQGCSYILVFLKTIDISYIMSIVMTYKYCYPGAQRRPAPIPKIIS